MNREEVIDLGFKLLAAGVQVELYQSFSEGSEFYQQQGLRVWGFSKSGTVDILPSPASDTWFILSRYGRQVELTEFNDILRERLYWHQMYYTRGYGLESHWQKLLQEHMPQELEDITRDLKKRSVGHE